MPYRLRGQIQIAETGAPIPGLRIAFWDRDLLIDDLLGEVETDQHGVFQLTYSPEQFSDGGLERAPDVYVRVFTPKGRKLLDTRAEPRMNIGPDQSLRIGISHTSFLPEDGPAYQVYQPQIVGRIYLESPKQRLSGVVVRAWDIVNQRWLYQRPSDENGGFQLWFADAHHLQIRVYRSDNNREIYRSAALSSAPGAVLTHNIGLDRQTLGREDLAFEQLHRRDPDLVRVFSKTFGADMPPQDIEYLISLMTERQLDVGDSLLQQGLPSTCLYLVTSGSLVVALLEGKEHIKVDRVGPGQWLGEVGFIDKQTASASVRCEEPSTLLALDHGCLQRIQTENPRAGSILLRNLCCLLSQRIDQCSAGVLTGRQKAAASVSSGSLRAHTRWWERSLKRLFGLGANP